MKRLIFFVFFFFFSKCLFCSTYKELIGKNICELEKSFRDSLVHCSYVHDHGVEVKVLVLDRKYSFLNKDMESATKEAGDTIKIQFQLRVYLINQIITRVDIVELLLNATLEESDLYGEVNGMKSFYIDSILYSGEAVKFIDNGLVVKAKLGIDDMVIRGKYSYILLSYADSNSSEYKGENGENIPDFGFFEVVERELGEATIKVEIVETVKYNIDFKRIKVKIENIGDSYLHIVLNKGLFDDEKGYRIIGNALFFPNEFGQYTHIFLKKNEYKELWIYCPNKLNKLLIESVSTPSLLSAHCYFTIRKNETILSLSDCSSK